MSAPLHPSPNNRAGLGSKPLTPEEALQHGRIAEAMAGAMIDAVSLSGACDRLALLERGFSEAEIDACEAKATELARRRFVRRLRTVQ